MVCTDVIESCNAAATRASNNHTAKLVGCLGLPKAEVSLQVWERHSPLAQLRHPTGGPVQHGHPYGHPKLPSQPPCCQHQLFYLLSMVLKSLEPMLEKTFKSQKERPVCVCMYVHVCIKEFFEKVVKMIAQ